MAEREGKGMREEMATMLLRRMKEVCQPQVAKADLDELVSLGGKLGGVLSTQWRKSWRRSDGWKETIWKDGNCSKADLVSNPAVDLGGLARLEATIDKLAKEVKSRQR